MSENQRDADSVSSPNEVASDAGEAAGQSDQTERRELAAPAARMGRSSRLTRRISNRFLYALLLTAYAAVAFGWLYPDDLSLHGTVRQFADWFALMVRTFTFHFGLGLAFLTILAFVRDRRRPALVAIPLCLFAMGPGLWRCVPRWTQASTAVALSASSDAGNAILRVASVNLYWKNATPEPLVEEMLALDADVLFLQEYNTAWHEILSARLSERYPHHHTVVMDNPFAMAIFSRVAFTSPVQESLPIPGLSPQFLAEIEWNGRRVALYNIHTYPPRGISGTAIQRAQMRALLGILAHETLPVILAGDFNFTEASTSAAALGDAGFTDAYDQGGYARGGTWPVSATLLRWMPGLRIDHIYLRGGLVCTSAITGQGEGSDHRPVVADLAWSEFAQRPD